MQHSGHKIYGAGSECCGYNIPVTAKFIIHRHGRIKGAVRLCRPGNRHNNRTASPRSASDLQDRGTGSSKNITPLAGPSHCPRLFTALPRAANVYQMQTMDAGPRAVCPSVAVAATTERVISKLIKRFCVCSRVPAHV